MKFALKVAAALAVLIGLSAMASAGGPVVTASSFGYGGYSRASNFSCGQQANYYPSYQAQAFVAVPVATAIVTPYAPVISAPLQAIAVPQAAVVPQQQVVLPQAAIVQSYAAFYSVPLVQSVVLFNQNYSYGYGHGHSVGVQSPVAVGRNPVLSRLRTPHAHVAR